MEKFDADEFLQDLRKRNQKSEPPPKENINPDDPLVRATRRVNLEIAAKREGSTTRCPKCSVLLPVSMATMVPSGKRYCPLCEIEFEENGS